MHLKQRLGMFTRRMVVADVKGSSRKCVVLGVVLRHHRPKRRACFSTDLCRVTTTPHDFSADVFERFATYSVDKSIHLKFANASDHLPGIFLLPVPLSPSPNHISMSSALVSSRRRVSRISLSSNPLRCGELMNIALPLRVGKMH